MVKNPWRRVSPRMRRRDIFDSLSLPDVLPLPSDPDGPPPSPSDTTTAEDVTDPSDSPSSTHQSSTSHAPISSSLPLFPQPPSTEVITSTEPSVTSTQTDVLTSDIPSMVTSVWVLTSGVAVVTVTSIVPNPTLAQFSDSQDNSFFSNKGAVIGTFTVVGVVIIAFFAALFLVLARRRKAIQFEREQDEAARAAARAPGFGFLDEVDDTYHNDEKSWGSSVAVGVQPVQNLEPEYGYTLSWAHPYAATSGSQSVGRSYTDNRFDTFSTTSHTVHPYASTTQPARALGDVPASFAPLTGPSSDDSHRQSISFNTDPATPHRNQRLPTQNSPFHPVSTLEGHELQFRHDSPIRATSLPPQNVPDAAASIQDDGRPPRHMTLTPDHHSSQVSSPTAGNFPLTPSMSTISQRSQLTPSGRASAPSRSDSSVSRARSAPSEEGYASTTERSSSPQSRPQRFELRFSGVFGTPHNAEPHQTSLALAPTLEVSIADSSSENRERTVGDMQGLSSTEQTRAKLRVIND